MLHGLRAEAAPAAVATPAEAQARGGGVSFFLQQ